MAEKKDVLASDKKHIADSANSADVNEATINSDRLLTVAQVAELLGCSVTSIYNWVPGGATPIPNFPEPLALGKGRTRFSEMAIQRFIAGLPTALQRQHHSQRKRVAA